MKLLEGIRVAIAQKPYTKGFSSIYYTLKVSNFRSNLGDFRTL